MAFNHRRVWDVAGWRRCAGTTATRHANRAHLLAGKRSPSGKADVEIMRRSMPLTSFAGLLDDA